MEVNKKRKHNLSQVQFDLKAADVRTLMSKVTVLMIACIPTWETQHEAYSKSRSALLSDLENETLLTAMVEDYEETRNCNVGVYDDNLHYLKLVPSDDPKDVTPEDSTAASPAATLALPG